MRGTMPQTSCTWWFNTPLAATLLSFLCLQRSPGVPLCADVKFLADQAALVTASADKSARLWSAGEDGAYKCAAVMKEHSAEVTAVTLHPLKDYFVTASLDKTWAFYDAQTATCLTQVRCLHTLAALLHPSRWVLQHGAHMPGSNSCCMLAVGQPLVKGAMRRRNEPTAVMMSYHSAQTYSFMEAHLAAWAGGGPGGGGRIHVRQLPPGWCHPGHRHRRVPGPCLGGAPAEGRHRTPLQLCPHSCTPCRLSRLVPGNGWDHHSTLFWHAGCVMEPICLPCQKLANILKTFWLHSCMCLCCQW